MQKDKDGHRTEEEALLFKEGLSVMSSLYASLTGTTVRASADSSLLQQAAREICVRESLPDGLLRVCARDLGKG